MGELDGEYESKWLANMTKQVKENLDTVVVYRPMDAVQRFMNRSFEESAFDTIAGHKGRTERGKVPHAKFNVDDTKLQLAELYSKRMQREAVDKIKRGIDPI